jgi:hypothetical protein
MNKRLTMYSHRISQLCIRSWRYPAHAVENLSSILITHKVPNGTPMTNSASQCSPKYHSSPSKQLSFQSPMRKHSSHDYHSPMRSSDPLNLHKSPIAPQSSSKRKSQISINHLLNFSLPQRQVDPLPPLSSSSRRKVVTTPFDKNRYINAKY